ncbi:NAD-P-binding protein [Mycena galericulata]|nr:NAD-P-binding protein [Mycena galericulata]
MPIPAEAKASNATFRPSYVPVAIFVGGTSGVGQGMVEAFVRHVKGRAHIVIVGRNERAAAEIIARLPKPDAGEAPGWTHEFVRCDVSLMANVRAACATIRTKVQRVNFLVLTAGFNAWYNPGITSEGLDLHLAMRYYYRFLFIQELLPLVEKAHTLGQDSKVMTVLSGGQGTPSRPIDLDNLGNTVKPRIGRFRVSFRGMMQSSNYTDVMIAHFATHHPAIAFTHIHPGVVKTSALRVDFDGILTPLTWFLNWLFPLLAVSQDEAAEHMLYGLFQGQRGLFLRDRYGNVISSSIFQTSVELGDSDKTGFLNGVPLNGYGASDLGVRRVMEHTEAVTRER